MNLDGEPKLPVLISFKFKLWCIVINRLLLRDHLAVSSDLTLQCMACCQYF